MPPTHEILALLLSDPMKTADLMDELAEDLKLQASALRAAHNPWKVPGGMADRVKMAVMGPNGNVIQSTDTGS